VQDLISWRRSFKRLKEEYEIAVKKKEALNGLLNAGRISQSTYDVFQKEIEDSIAETERQQRALIAKMDSKSLELETQIKTLEMLLASFEIQHVTKELDDDAYQRQNDLLTVGLDTMKQELENVKSAMNQLSNSFDNVQSEKELESQEPVEISSTTVELSAEKGSIDEPAKTENSSAAENPEEPHAVEAEAIEQEQKA